MMRPITARRQGEKPSTDVAALLSERSEQFRAEAAECHQIAEHYCESIKEQYEMLARQWLVVAELNEWQVAPK